MTKDSPNKLNKLFNSSIITTDLQYGSKMAVEIGIQQHFLPKGLYIRKYCKRRVRFLTFCSQLFGLVNACMTNLMHLEYSGVLIKQTG